MEQLRIYFLEIERVTRSAIEEERQLGHAGDCFGIAACDSGLEGEQNVLKSAAAHRPASQISKTMTVSISTLPFDLAQLNSPRVKQPNTTLKGVAAPVTSAVSVRD